MKRKTIYAVLALPFVVAVIYLAVLPSATRATFLSEFKHRTAKLFGYEASQPEGAEKGLRSERPEEYGPQPASGDEGAALPEEADDTEAPIVEPTNGISDGDAEVGNADSE